MSDETSIVPIVDPTSVFTRGGTTVDAVIADIKQRAGSLVFDMRTAAGRSYCASVAYQVSRSKTLIDNAGKEIVSDWKAKSRKVDLDRKKIRDELDAVRDAVRAPLNEWEARQAREKERRVRQIAHIKSIGSVVDQGGDNRSAAGCEYRLELLNDIPEPDDWFRSMLPEAMEAYQTARDRLASAIVLRREEERVAAEEAERAAQAARAVEEAAQAEARRKIEADKDAAVARARAEEQERAEQAAQAVAKAEEELKAAAVEEALAGARAEDQRKAEAVEAAKEAEAAVIAAEDRPGPSCISPTIDPAVASSLEVDIDIRAAVVSALIDLKVPASVVYGVFTAIAAGQVPYVTLNEGVGEPLSRCCGRCTEPAERTK